MHTHCAFGAAHSLRDTHDTALLDTHDTRATGHPTDCL